METKDFICVCLGISSKKVDDICDNFNVDISDKEVYDILNLFEGSGFQNFGDLLTLKLFRKVEDRAVEELGLKRELFDSFLNGYDTHFYYSKVEMYRWEDLEDIASLNDDEE